eukprot:COSAG02_NODE_6556_length_3499_cov_1.878235_3_plen_56_part_00
MYFVVLWMEYTTVDGSGIRTKRESWTIPSKLQVFANVQHHQHDHDLSKKGFQQGS